MTEIRMENRIKEILKEKNMSILKLSKIMDMNYATMHSIVNRPDLGTTQAKTLLTVAKTLEVNITDLWK